MAKSFSLKLEGGQRITKVMVDHGFVVDGIGFEITDKNGANNVKWFTGSGGSRSEVPLGADEYITKISGSYGVYHGNVNIATLRIHTNVEPNGYGPFGSARDVANVQPFSSPESESGSISGFFGSYETFLASIGVYIGYGPYGRI